MSNQQLEIELTYMSALGFEAVFELDDVHMIEVSVIFQLTIMVSRIPIHFLNRNFSLWLPILLRFALYEYFNMFSRFCLL